MSTKGNPAPSEIPLLFLIYKRHETTKNASRPTRGHAVWLTLYLMVVSWPLLLNLTLPVLGYFTNSVPFQLASMNKHLLIERDTATDRFLRFHSMCLPNLLPVAMNSNHRVSKARKETQKGSPHKAFHGIEFSSCWDCCNSAGTDVARTKIPIKISDHLLVRSIYRGSNLTLNFSLTLICYL